MRLKLIIPILAAGAVALASAASGQEARKYDETDTATVVSVDPGTERITVKDEAGTEKEFRIDGKTRILRGGDAISLADIEKDARVVVNARQAAPGDEIRGEIAEYIQVVVSETPPVGYAPPKE